MFIQPSPSQIPCLPLHPAKPRRCAREMSTVRTQAGAAPPRSVGAQEIHWGSRNSACGFHRQEAPQQGTDCCAVRCASSTVKLWPEKVTTSESLSLLICKMELLLILSYLQGCYEGQQCVLKTARPSLCQRRGHGVKRPACLAQNKSSIHGGCYG